MVHIGQPWNTDPRQLRLRPFDGSASDLAALSRVRNETLRAVSLPEDYREWHAEEMERFYNRAGFELAGNSWLIHLGEEPVAAAVVYPRSLFPDRPPGNFDMYVIPAHRRHGLGSRLLAHLEQAAVGRGHRVLETTIAGEDEGSSGFLSRHGFAVVGQSMRLSRYGLDDLPPLSLPPGYSIGSLAETGEALDLYREMTNRLGSYDANYSLVTPEEMERVVSGEGWEPGGVFFLVDPGGRIVGVIRASGAGTGRGELHEIRLEPSLRGMGLGRALLAVALQYLAEAGVRLVELSTASDQVAAHRLALSAGFAVTRHWLHFMKRL
jgi:GNAT superfamily N-acetyltransferase